MAFKRKNPFNNNYKMTKYVAKQKGEIWEMHNHDVDIFPSCPHMHAKDKPWKLDIYTGDVYDINTKKVIKNIGKKALESIWSNKAVQTIVVEERRRYEEMALENPHKYKPLPPLLHQYSFYIRNYLYGSTKCYRWVCVIILENGKVVIKNRDWR